MFFFTSFSITTYDKLSRESRNSGAKEFNSRPSLFCVEKGETFCHRCFKFSFSGLPRKYVRLRNEEKREVEKERNKERQEQLSKVRRDLVFASFFPMKGTTDELRSRRSMNSGCTRLNISQFENF